MSGSILTMLVLVPLVGGIGVLFTGKDRPALARQVALVVSLITLVLSLVMWWRQTVRRRGAEP